ncbi:MAG: nitric oxide reductase NorD protein, partial [Blastocatellia bacterium]|nr:nitric oxide reductase NorD protein [Blastocatellia bacterium]
DQNLDRELSEHLRGVKGPAERRTIAGLAREVAKLPLDHARTALEVSASIAGVSLRASIEFLRAAPAAAQILQAEELRSWGEIGRRVAMGNLETAVEFFQASLTAIGEIPSNARTLLWQICTRQSTLSSAAAIATFFDSAPRVAQEISDPDLLCSIFEIASEISRRSAKHSADFLNAAPQVVANLSKHDPPGNAGSITGAAVELTAAFAARAGGIASDAWLVLPEAIAGLDEANILKLFKRAGGFLERSGSAAIQLLIAGGAVLRALPEVFDEWIDLLGSVAGEGNASVVAFIRAGPRFFQTIATGGDRQPGVTLARRVIALAREVAQVDAEAALACLRSSGRALRTVSIEQFETWARTGLSFGRGNARARRSYYALETRGSNDALRSGGAGLTLESIQHLLRLYIEGLTGEAVEIVPLAAVPLESRIDDGRTIHLPGSVAEFDDDELDFRLYKVLAAHGAGQIEFGTYERDSDDLRAAREAIAALYDPDQRDAFSVGQTFLPVPEADESVVSDEKMDRQECLSYKDVLNLFPIPRLARRIFGTLENGRIDRRLRARYRGLARDLDLIQEHLRTRRPRMIDLPEALVPFELLFQVTLLGGALDDARQMYGQIISELETIVAEYLFGERATVADSLLATNRVYSLFQSISAEDSDQQIEIPEESAAEDETESISETFRPQETDRQPQRRDAHELFNAWNTDNEGEPDDLDGSEAWSQAQVFEQDLEPGEVAFNYDEWDRDLTDHRVGWCRVVEKKVARGTQAFVEQTRERHRGAISSIRHQFQLMKPENLVRVVNELDGEEFDLNAVVDYVIDRRAARAVGGSVPSERIYTKRLRRRRDVAVSFLLDQSSSTARTIGRHPLQPYTHPGQRIIEIEKEGLVLMSEALEAVGDVYSINGFTSEGRRNVKFYIVKDFNESYSGEVQERIGGISYQNNTRLGAAIRHAAARLAKQEARTRLLIVLSDGRPYDHDYGDARYAREDTREALRQTKNQGITPFCITIDRESEAELRDLYGEVGYTIIDDIMNLPERMPGIYRRLTT